MSERLTDEELAELERLEREATPRPWEVSVERMRPNAYDTIAGPQDEDGRSEVAITDCDRDGCSGSNARFLAAARNALPSLLAEVRASRAAPDPGEEGLRPEVLAFARTMSAKIDGHNHDRGVYGWRTATPARLMEWLERYVTALAYALDASTMQEVLGKAANVANIAMMIADVSGALASSSSAPAARETRCPSCGSEVQCARDGGSICPLHGYIGTPAPASAATGPLDALREALEAAAKSLEWIASQRPATAASDEGRSATGEVLREVRQYAHSRANAARAALRSGAPGDVSPTPPQKEE